MPGTVDCEGVQSMGSRTCQRRNCPILLTVLAVLLGHGASAQTVTLPFRTEESLLVVRVFVNGRSANLILDTGAESTFLSPQAAGISNTVGVTRLRSNAQIAKSMSRNAAISLTENGSIFSQPVIVVDLNDLNRKVGCKCDGILGQDVLRRFRAITVDYKNKTVAFTP
jgi:hypothetical protein